MSGVDGLIAPAPATRAPFLFGARRLDVVVVPDAVSSEPLPYGPAATKVMFCTWYLFLSVVSRRVSNMLFLFGHIFFYLLLIALTVCVVSVALC